VERPRRLESEGVAVPGSRFTYAVGRLVLWSAKPGVVDPKGDVLRNGDFRKLAIANPTLAPYGAAARQLLLAMDLWDRLQGRLVVGQNIGQTHQFVASGNAELGLVALSQVEAPGRPLKGSHWIVPRRLYEPIQQQAVRLDESRAARRFMEFVRGPEAARIIESYGYGVPE
jgi:molybdate transport system substrate-binding protein